MLRKIAVITVLVSVIALIGCGGDAGVSHAVASPFAGTYQGTFTTTNPQSGTLQGTVSTLGTFTGTAHNDTVNQDATVRGTIQNTGETSVAFSYPGFVASASGTVAFAANGHLTGTLTQSTGGSVTVDLVKQ
jgi:hypothetical protein